MEQEMITKRSDYKVLASASHHILTWDCCCTQIQNEPSQLELPLGLIISSELNDFYMFGRYCILYQCLERN